tara:strand:- start:426 stop:1145 length:720 start_codon:yes stop_codon:yes gene_type:complete
MKMPKSTDVRLNKFISSSGICSRREADKLIEKGLVFINGKKCDKLGKKISIKDKIKVRGKEISPEKKVYILLNKPKDFITSRKDENNRKTVFELLKGIKERVFYVGRLDRNTTGLLLFTNDGELSKRLTHPSYKVKKIYSVTLDKEVQEVDIKKIKEGLNIDNEKIIVDEIIKLEQKKEVGIEIHIGKNRIVRKIFESLGYKVKKLDRVLFGDLTKKKLPRGKWRRLNNSEIQMLKKIK